MRPWQTPHKPHYCDCVESYKKCTNSKGLLMMYSAFEDKTRKSLRGIMGDVHSHKHATGAAVRREWWNWKTERYGHYPSLWSDDFNIGAFVSFVSLFEQSLLDSSVYNVPNRCPDHILCPRVGSTSGMCCQQRFQWENRMCLLHFVTFVRALRWMLIAAGQVHDILFQRRPQVENGDMNWIIPDKFLAFAGPSPTSTDAEGSLAST